MYVMYAYMTLPAPEKSKSENVRIDSSTRNGRPHNSHGRQRPHLLRVPSMMPPRMGATTASITRTTSISVLTTIGVKPTASV